VLCIRSVYFDAVQHQYNARSSLQKRLDLNNHSAVFYNSLPIKRPLGLITAIKAAKIQSRLYGYGCIPRWYKTCLSLELSNFRSRSSVCRTNSLHFASAKSTRFCITELKRCANQILSTLAFFYASLTVACQGAGEVLGSLEWRRRAFVG